MTATKLFDDLQFWELICHLIALAVRIIQALQFRGHK